jgi:hypothetical protein
MAAWQTSLIQPDVLPEDQAAVAQPFVLVAADQELNKHLKQLGINTWK